MDRRLRHLKRLLTGVAVIWIACGGNGATFELTVVNTLQSTQPILVDLGGEVRSLNIGEITIFRSVTPGRHILSIESATCAGTVRDTLSVDGDTTIRYLATRDAISGECRVESTATPTQKSQPISLATP